MRKDRTAASSPRTWTIGQLMRSLPIVSGLLSLGWSAVAEGQETFGLDPPVRITKAYHYRDGGTVGFELEDSSGHTLQGAFDNRIHIHHIPTDKDSIFTNDMPPRHCYVGGLPPTEYGARSLPLNGTEERDLVHLL